MVQDLSYNLCESLVENIDGVADIGKKTPPTPITYLTQWKIVGNSEVHTDKYLTSWKVSGNSIVDNNTILSCGDLGQDGKYHVKISNGTTIYDILLTEPLRKVNDVADTIEFPSSTEGKALVTRKLMYDTLDDKTWTVANSRKVIISGYWRPYQKDVFDNSNEANVLVEGFITYSYNSLAMQINAGAAQSRGDTGSMCLYDDGYIPESGNTPTQTFYDAIAGKHILIELATPITELIDVSPFPVSPTDTYTSANVVPYSAFEHTENNEIWSCGEYNPTDGKYHILVQPQGGSIADIALDAPLRKVNNIADTIEFPSGTEGKALVTRNNVFIQKSFNGGYLDSSGTVFFSASISNNIVNLTYGDTFTISICNKLGTRYYAQMRNANMVAMGTYSRAAVFRNYEIEQTVDAYKAWLATLGELDLICQLETPTTELVDAPQIEEAESYNCVISQGGKAVEWSVFETE